MDEKRFLETGKEGSAIDDQKDKQEPVYQKCNLLYNDDSVPVFIVEQIFNQDRQPVDMTQPIFDRMGRQVNVLSEETTNSFGNGEYYDSNNNPIWLIKKMLVYIPLKGIFDRYGNNIYSSKREDNLVLYDQLGRPVYPVSGPMGDFFDKGHYVYPALGPTGRCYYTKSRLEVIPPQIQLFDKNGKPVYPYSEVDESAMDAKTVETYDPYSQPFMGMTQNQSQMQDSENSNAEEVNESEETGFKAWCKNPKNKPKLYGIIALSILFIMVAGYGIFALVGNMTSKFELVQDTVNYELDKEMKLNIEDFLGKGYPQDVEVVMDKNLVYNTQKKTFTDRGKSTVSLGEYDIEFKHDKESLKAKLIIEDTTDPVIEGPNSVEFGIGDYTESAFIAKYDITDASSMQVSVENYGKNLLNEGSYQVEINVKDSAGNKATKTVNVTVKKSAAQIAEDEQKAAEEKAAEEAAALKAAEEAAQKAQEQNNALQEQINNMQQRIEELTPQSSNQTNEEQSGSNGTIWDSLGECINFGGN